MCNYHSYIVLCLQLSLPATWMEDRLPNQQSFMLVRFQTPITFAMKHYSCIYSCLSTGDSPRITTHPKDVKDVIIGKPASFMVQVAGKEPLCYQWKHKPRSGSEGWLVCDVERFPGADSSTLTIPSVQKSNEGSYHCTVSNCADIETTYSAMLTLGELEYYTCDWASVVIPALAATTIYTRWWVEGYLWIPSHKFGARKGFASYLLIQQAPPPGTQMFPSTVLLPAAKYLNFLSNLSAQLLLCGTQYDCLMDG